MYLAYSQVGGFHHVHAVCSSYSTAKELVKMPGIRIRKITPDETIEWDGQRQENGAVDLGGSPAVPDADDLRG